MEVADSPFSSIPWTISNLKKTSQILKKMNEEFSKTSFAENDQYSFGKAVYGMDPLSLSLLQKAENLLKDYPVEQKFNILISGCGNGGFLPWAFLTLGSNVHLTLCDLLPENIDQMCAYLNDFSCEYFEKDQDKPSWETLVQDARTFEKKEVFHLIVGRYLTHFLSPGGLDNFFCASLNSLSEGGLFFVTGAPPFEIKDATRAYGQEKKKGNPSPGFLSYRMIRFSKKNQDKEKEGEGQRTEAFIRAFFEPASNEEIGIELPDDDQQLKKVFQDLKEKKLLEYKQEWQTSVKECQDALSFLGGGQDITVETQKYVTHYTTTQDLIRNLKNTAKKLKADIKFINEGYMNLSGNLFTSSYVKEDYSLDKQHELYGDLVAYVIVQKKEASENSNCNCGIF